MDGRLYLIVFITLVVATVFLFAWRRRDEGREPVDRVADALHEPLDGRSPG